MPRKTTDKVLDCRLRNHLHMFAVTEREQSCNAAGRVNHAIARDFLRLRIAVLVFVAIYGSLSSKPSSPLLANAIKVVFSSKMSDPTDGLIAARDTS